MHTDAFEFYGLSAGVWVQLLHVWPDSREHMIQTFISGPFLKVPPQWLHLWALDLLLFVRRFGTVLIKILLRETFICILKILIANAKFEIVIQINTAFDYSMIRYPKGSKSFLCLLGLQVMQALEILRYIKYWLRHRHWLVLRDLFQKEFPLT